MNWSPVWALPNIVLDEAVESEFFALVPEQDERIRTLKREYPNLRIFLRQFRDIYRHRTNPALIMRRDNAPEYLCSGEAAASFRDILVTAIVPKAWSRNLIYENRRDRASTSMYFWVHPWMIDRNYEHAIAHTPTTLALHEVSAISAQASPELTPLRIRSADFDAPLMAALFARHHDRYMASRPTWENVALFRSLNFANSASRFPFSADSTIYDFGRQIGLWVSAFETLVHPGETGQTNLGRVFGLLESVPWLDKRCAQKRYKTGHGRIEGRRNLSCSVYYQLHQRRNDFLHGNPVTMASLREKRSKRLLVEFAAPLYRLGLSSFLSLKFQGEAPPMEDAEEIARFMTNKWSFEQPQQDAEEAMRKALITAEEAERQRQAIRDQQRRRRRNNP